MHCSVHQCAVCSSVQQCTAVCSVQQCAAVCSSVQCAVCSVLTELHTQCGVFPHIRLGYFFYSHSATPRPGIKLTGKATTNCNARRRPVTSGKSQPAVQFCFLCPSDFSRERISRDLNHFTGLRCCVSCCELLGLRPGLSLAWSLE